MQLLSAVPDLGNAGPDCDPCGGTRNVIVKTEREREREKSDILTNVWMKNLICPIFVLCYLLLIEQTYSIQ